MKAIRKPAPSDVRVLVAAGEPLEGRALKLLLDTAGYRAVHVETVSRARRMLGSPLKEVLLWVDGRLDASAAAEVLELRRDHGEVGLCLLARGADPSALRALLLASAEGVAFLHRARRPGPDELVDALGLAASGQSMLEPRLVERLVAELEPPGESLDWLSDGERKVLELVADGLRNEAIARRLCKSQKTVEKRVSQVFAKLGLDAREHPDLDRRVAAARIFLAANA